MTAKRVARTKMESGPTLKERVQKAVRRTWGQVAADVDWPVTLDEAVELSLDADRPVTLGGLSQEDYTELLEKVDPATQERWGREALKGLI